MIDGHWLASHRADPRAVSLYARHYSAYRYRDGRRRTRFVGPGESMILLTVNCDALFVWLHNTVERFDKQEGVNCTVFRNESSIRSSDLIREAVSLAWRRWPGKRLFTYVGDAKIRSSNPGYCFQMAGWRKCGRNADGRLTILEILPPAMEARAA